MIPNFKSLHELYKAFPDKKTCHQYIAAIRWGGYMECPHKGCQGDSSYVFKDGIRYKCKTCKKQYTAIKGTFMENTGLELVQWFATFHILRLNKGITASGLVEVIGCTEATAWFVLKRIRTGMANVGSKKKIEHRAAVDVTFVGGKNKNRHKDQKFVYQPGRGYPDKTPVFGMIGRNGEVRAWVINSESAKEIRPLIYSNLNLGATLVTDEFKTYNMFKGNFRHVKVNHRRGQYQNEGHTTNGVENFWSQLKRKINGLHHHVSRKHLNDYVQERVFKHNNRHLNAAQTLDLIIKQSECRITKKEAMYGKSR